MEATIIFEERTNIEHTILWESMHVIHLNITAVQPGISNLDLIFDSTNRLTIYFRDELRDDFKYEVIFHMLTRAAMVNNMKFCIHYFDEIDDMNILNVICGYFNKYHNQKLTIEHGTMQYILRNGNNIILQSFF